MAQKLDVGMRINPGKIKWSEQLFDYNMIVLGAELGDMSIGVMMRYDKHTWDQDKALLKQEVLRVLEEKMRSRMDMAPNGCS